LGLPVVKRHRLAAARPCTRPDTRIRRVTREIAMSKTQTDGHSNSKLAKGKLASAKPETIPTRLHHAAYVCRDLEQTRKFYEDILGWPMVAAWRDCDKVFGEDELYYCHLFFEI